jgi:hypothetical protein
VENFFGNGKQNGSHSRPGDDRDQDLENRLRKIEGQLMGQEKTTFKNNLLLARKREEQDTISNTKHVDGLIITGIKMSDPLPTEGKLRVEALRKVQSISSKHLFQTFKEEFPSSNVPQVPQVTDRILAILGDVFGGSKRIG